MDTTLFQRLVLDGIPVWRHLPSGYTFPAIAGGDGTEGEGSGSGSGDGGSDSATGEGGSTQPQPKTYDEAYVRKLRDEAASHRTKVRELEGQIKTLPQDTVAKIFSALGLEPDPTKNLETQLAAAKATAEGATQTANARLIAAEAKVQAAALGVKPDRVSHALKLADLSTITVGEDGEPNAVAIKAALEAVVKDLPELKGAQAAARSGGEFNGTSQQPRPQGLAAALRAHYEKT